MELSSYWHTSRDTDVRRYRMQLRLCFLSCAVATSLMTSSGETNVRMCTNSSLLTGMHDAPLTQLDTNTLVQSEDRFKSVDDSSLMKCAKECKLSSICKNFNFNLTNGECNLFSNILANTTGISEIDGVIYAHDTDTWPNRLAGGCTRSTCSPITAREGNESCSIAKCLHPPVIANGWIKLTSPNQTRFDVGQVDFFCRPMYLPRNVLRCRFDGTWTSPACAPIHNCKSLKLCNRNYGDGEYWLFVKGTNNSTRIRVYCNQMSSKTPDHFISLLQENYSQSLDTCPQVCGRTNYTKLAITPWNLAVRPNIDTFSSGTCGVAKAGMTLSCAKDPSDSVACGRAGTYRVDLRGTGFRVRPDSKWTTAAAQATAVVTHSNSWDVVDVTCYADSVCRPCYAEIITEVDEGNQPGEETAVVPVCT